MIVDDFQGKRILVVGDVMLDHFVRGSVSRVSPEAPTLVLHAHVDSWAIGGAGNVARNIASLGGVAHLIGLVGKDAASNQIAAQIDENPGIVNGLVSDERWPTIEKVRFIAGDNHLLRVDREIRKLPDDIFTPMLAQVRSVIGQCDAVVISDYAKGIVSTELIKGVMQAAKDAAVPVVADPKRPNFADYRGAAALTPNRKELSAATGLPADTDEEIEFAIPLAIEQFEGPIVLTRSEQGISLFRSGKAPVHDPARNRALRDVSGAGDTVAATLVLGLASGASLEAAMLAANAAAGVVVAKSGTATVDAAELISAMLRDIDGEVLESKLAPIPQAEAIRQEWRDKGLRVGLTNGCFDIIHRGHVTLLRAAKARCDKLIVALNTDASVQRLKGPERPIQTEAARAEVIAAMEYVDMVLLFDEDTPLRIIELLAPDVLLKGSDYTVETVVGSDVVLKQGGKVELIDLVEGFSTTKIIQKSRQVA